ncbi:hypothetical protein Pelo_4568 [Pelomyxa schiedti]|nr:hypothetical protein Pelo_4568 [Pelomyxa schiedti]
MDASRQEGMMRGAAGLRWNDPGVWVAYGEWCGRVGRLAEGISLCKRAVYLDSSNLESYLALQNLYTLQNDLRKAKQVLETAVVLAAMTTTTRSGLRDEISSLEDAISKGDFPAQPSPSTSYKFSPSIVQQIAFSLDPFSIADMRLVCRDWCSTLSSCDFRRQYLLNQGTHTLISSTNWEEEYLQWRIAYCHWHMFHHFEEVTHLLSLQMPLPNFCETPCSSDGLYQFELTYSVHLPTSLQYHYILQNGFSLVMPSSNMDSGLTCELFPMTKFYIYKTGKLFFEIPVPGNKVINGAHKFVIGQVSKVEDTKKLVLNLDQTEDTYGQVLCVQGNSISAAYTDFYELMDHMCEFYYLMFIDFVEKVSRGKKYTGLDIPPRTYPSNSNPRKPVKFYGNYRFQKHC